MKEEALALRASRRQVEEELAAKNAELLASRRRLEEELAAKDMEINSKAAETAAAKDDLQANNEELASVRLTARRYEDELDTLRSALRQGERRAAFAAASSAVPPPPVAAAAAGSRPPASRFQGEPPPCQGCQGRLSCQCDAAATPSMVQSQAVPPPPARRRSCWSSSAPWWWWRTDRTPCVASCGTPYGTPQYVPFPVRLQSPWLLSWARRVTGCGPRRHGSPGVLFTRQY